MNDVFNIGICKNSLALKKKLIFKACIKSMQMVVNNKKKYELTDYLILALEVDSHEFRASHFLLFCMPQPIFFPFPSTNFPRLSRRVENSFPPVR